MSFAAGVMLAAAVLGLILPSLEYGGDFAIAITVLGIFCGALILNVIDKVVPHLHKMIGPDIEEHHNANLSKVLLFVIAIAIHNLPEGIAAGVGFGTGNVSQALVIAGGVGNLIDRIRFKEVVDFIKWEVFEFPVFNIADICIVVGAFMACFYYIFIDKDEKTPKKREAVTAETEAVSTEVAKEADSENE